MRIALVTHETLTGNANRDSRLLTGKIVEHSWNPRIRRWAARSTTEHWAKQLLPVGTMPSLHGKADAEFVRSAGSSCQYQLEASNLLTETAICLPGPGQSLALAGAEAKRFSMQAGVQDIGGTMRFLGVAGVPRDLPIARQLANANTALFVDGTTDVQNTVMVRDRLGA